MLSKIVAGTKLSNRSPIRRVIGHRRHHCDENRSYEVADAEGKKSVMRMSAIGLLHSLQYASSEIEELIEFAEENLPGVTIGGAKHTWEKLCANGYKVRSSALRARGQGNGPRPQILHKMLPC